MIKWLVYWFCCALFGIAIGTGLQCAGCTQSSPLSERESYDAARTQTLMMLNPDKLTSGGTGFEVKALSGRVYTLTNSHVCNLARGSYLVARKGERDRRVQIIASAPEVDLCVLEGIPGYEGLTLATHLDMYAPTHIVGHPLLQPVTIASGYFNGHGEVPVSYCFNGTGAKYKAYDVPELDLTNCLKIMSANFSSANSLPGNSGSPVTDEYGNVVGVLFAGNGMGLSLIVPLEKIREFLSFF